MRHPIDPRVDCVFKALLGSVPNCNLLIHFINAILAQELSDPITSVDILNPYNDKEFFSDKLSIVDIKAKDSQDRLYQIEIQLANHKYMLERILAYWANIYTKQLQSGNEYDKLKPTYAIWLLAKNLIKDDNHYLHQYKMRDQHQQLLCAHGGIWLLELNKFQVDHIVSEDQRWLKFLKEGEQLNDTSLPDWMNTQEMKQAMQTLSTFSEKEREYDRYHARQEYIRVQNAIEEERREMAQESIEMAKQKAEMAKQKAEMAKQSAEMAKQLAQVTEQAVKNEQALKQALEQERLKFEQALQKELAEIDRLKALLADRIKIL